MLGNVGNGGKVCLEVLLLREDGIGKEEVRVGLAAAGLQALVVREAAGCLWNSGETLGELGFDETADEEVDRGFNDGGGRDRTKVSGDFLGDETDEEGDVRVLEVSLCPVAAERT